jgi:hypothetical protein
MCEFISRSSDGMVGRRWTLSWSPLRPIVQYALRNRKGGDIRETASAYPPAPLFFAAVPSPESDISCGFVILSPCITYFRAVPMFISSAARRRLSLIKS